MPNQRAPRFGAIASLLLAFAACHGGDALVLFTVVIAEDVPEYQRIRFATASTSREIDARSGRRFRFGYYHPSAPNGVRIEAKVFDGNGCVVGGGWITTPSLSANRTTELGDLSIDPANDTSGCGADAGAPPPPLTVTLSPAHLARDVDRRAPLVLRFSAPIDRASVESAVSLREGEHPIPVAVAIDESGRTVTLTPASTLPMLASLSLTVDQSVRGRAGRALGASATATFTTADGVWGQPVELQRHVNAPVPSYSGGLALATEPGGRALVLWERVIGPFELRGYKAQLHASRHDPGQGWRPDELLATGEYGPLAEPAAGIDRVGYAYAIHDRWSEDRAAGRTLWVRRAYSTGQWRAEERLDPVESDSHGARIVVAPTGEAIAAWERWDSPAQSYRMVASRYGAAAGWTPPEPVDLPPVGTQYKPRVIGDVGLDGKGNFLVVWGESRQPDVQGSHWANRYTPAAGWGAPVNLSGSMTGERGAGRAGIAVDAAGNAIAVYTQRANPAGAPLVFAVQYDAATGSWTAPGELAMVEGNAPRIAMNPAGEAIACWRANVLDVACRRHREGQWLEPRASKPTKSSTADIGVGIDARGLALVHWRALDERPGVETPSGFVARETAVAGIQRPVTLNASELSGPLRVSVLPDGTAWAVWVEGRAPHRVMAARFE